MPAPPVPFGVPAQFRGQTLTSYQPTFREAATDILRRALFSDDRAGQRKAERVSNVLETLTPFGFATGIDDMREAVGQGDYATAGMMGAMAMVPGPSPKIKAYHGSPHSFDRFDMSKIGTGEGAQAYGHGLYKTETPDIGRGYRDSIMASKGIDPEMKIGKTPINDFYSNMEQRLARMPAKQAEEGYNQLALMEDLAYGGDVLYIREKAAQGAYSPQTMEWFENTIAPQFNRKGTLYEVNINASPDDFLDWDKPLFAQSPKVKEWARKEFASPNNPGLWADTMEGERAYQSLKNRAMSASDPGDRKSLDAYGSVVAEKLKQAGIPGIKYLDAGSRGKGDGSRNYVVFDDKLIEIVRKYGIAGASAMAGYNILDGMDEAQAKELKKIDGSGW